MDPRLVRIDVVGVSTLKRQRGMPPDSQIGLDYLAADLQRSTASPFLVVSAGNILALPDTPLGLLIEDGKITSRLDVRTLRSGTQYSNDPGCKQLLDDVGERRFSGVLCVRDASQPQPLEVMLTKDFESNPPYCRSAVQVWPILVHPRDGSIGICQSEPRDLANSGPAVRAAACTSRDGRFRLAITDGRTFLLPFATWLRASTGLDCRAAVNLIGDYFAGAVYFASRSEPTLRVGNTKIPQASVLVIGAR